MSTPFAVNFPGMEAIPLMLLCLIGGLVAGAIGILVGLAVGRSRFAFWAGLVACAAGTGSPLFFLILVGRYLSPEAYPVLALPLLAGLPAVLLSFRPSLSWLGEAEENRRPSPAQSPRTLPPAWVANRAVRVTLVLGLAAAALFGGCVMWQKPRHDYKRLLAGDTHVEITSVLIDRQGKKILLNDPASARYLTDVFRSAQLDPPGLGTSYTAQVRLASGGSVEVALYMPGEAGWVAVTSPLGSLDDPTFYWVRLPEPMPAPVAEALRNLR